MNDGRQYVTAYYVVEKVVQTQEVIRDRRLRLRYRNPHLHREEYEEEKMIRPDDTLVFGHKRLSRTLGIPLQLSRSILQNLAKPVPFRDDRTDAENISSGLRQPKDLTEEDVKFLLEQIRLNNTRGEFPLPIPTWREAEIADVLEKNPEFLDAGLKFIRREMITRAGHIDLLFENGNGDLLVVELKDETAKSIDQVMDYVRTTEQENPGRRVRGAIVCPGAEPRLLRNAIQGGILIYMYVGKFHIKRAVLPTLREAD
jgi:hypothetical protein